ncbi:hypothetical protein H2277_06335 [Campylobacter sp. W0014]|uniref:hypothetical protein n=1 Tax=Campylobacter sp. W0014 TaxID=2735781 RepID=UPI001EBEC4E9|nr:hypothetical protein [Campylobacter sp. W0014]
MLRKMILLLFLGCAVLNAQPIGECNNFLIIQKLKDILKDKILQNAYDSSGLKGMGVDYEEYLEKAKEYPGAMVEINSISSFEKIRDNECLAIVDAKVMGDKGFFTITYEILNSHKVKITNIIMR